MEHQTDKTSPPSSLIRIACIAAIVLAISSCSHCPPVGLSGGEADRFVNVWEVAKIRVIGSDAPPVNVEGVFTLTRTANRPSQFGVIPGKNFSGISERWKDLTLRYQRGKGPTEPPKSLAALFSSNQTQAQAASYNKSVEPIKPDVLAEIFQGLKDEKRERLTGSLEINGKPNFITIYSFGVKQTASESLVIFYCETERCDHSGMIIARPK